MILQQDILSILMGNAIHDIDTGSGKVARMAFLEGGKATMQRPDGTINEGAWHLRDDGYNVDWHNGPSAQWTLKAAPGRIAYVDATGVERGQVSAIAFLGPEASVPWLDAK